jgi:hypothetical protein
MLEAGSGLPGWPIAGADSNSTRIGCSASNAASACSYVMPAKRSGGSVSRWRRRCRCRAPRGIAPGEGRRLRDFLAHVERQELDPAMEDRRDQRLAVAAVHQGEVLLVGAGEVVDHVRGVAADLLVLPRVGEEDGHVDVVHEQRRRDRIGDLGT